MFAAFNISLKGGFFTELYQKLFSDSEKEIALFMYNVGIIKEPVLYCFEDYSGIFERLFKNYLSDPNVSALKTVSEDVYLRVLGMHAFGAGAWVAAKEADFGHSVLNFSEDEANGIFADFDSADAYELALKMLGIPIDSGNRQMLDRVIVIGIKEAKLISKEKIAEPENLKAFIKVLFNAGASVFASQKKNLS